MTGFGEWADGLNREHEQLPARRGRPPKWNIEELSGQLYDLLAGAPIVCEHGVRGYGSEDLCELLDVPLQVLRRTVRNQRLLFGDDDEVNIPVHRCGMQQYYHLTGQVAGGRAWQMTRLRNMIAQQEVNVAWWQSMARASQHDRVLSLYTAAVLHSSQRMLEDMQRVLTAVGS